MTPIEGPATLPRTPDNAHSLTLDQVLTLARSARGTLRPPQQHWSGTSSHVDGDQLFSYWENRLDPVACQQIEEHALDCEECWRWLVEIGKMFGK